MPQLDMACIKLKQLILNPYAVERYTIMHAIDYEHPGWVEAQNRLNQPRSSNHGNYHKS